MGPRASDIIFRKIQKLALEPPTAVLDFFFGFFDSHVYNLSNIGQETAEEKCGFTIRPSADFDTERRG